MPGIIALLVFLAAMTVIIILTVKYRLNAAVVLIVVTIFCGLFIGPPAAEVLSTIRNGFGYTLGYAGILIVEGMIMAVILECSGIMKFLAERIVNRTGKEKSVLSVSLTGYAVSIPVSCDSGFVTIAHLNEPLAKASGKSLAVIAVALSTGLYATHCLVPPTPGPVTAMGILNANGYLVTVLGLIVSVPAMLAGYFWASRYMGSEKFVPEFDTERDMPDPSSSFDGSLFFAALPFILPLILMALRSLAMMPSRPLGNGITTEFINFTGDPVISLFIAIAVSVFIVKKKHTASEVNKWCTEGIKRAAPILIITGAGGAFGAVIKASPLTTYAVSLMSGWHIGILLPFIIAAFLKTATGSSTVSIITASSVIAPITAKLGVNPALAVLAVGSGSMMVSHVNDPFFWIVSSFSGMDQRTALRFFTPATAITGTVSFIFVAILSLFIGQG